MLGRKQSNILVIKTDSLSGFVAADPVFEAIRKAHRKAKISLLTTQGLQRIARASPYFDQVAAMPNLRDRDARREFVRQVKSSKFEQVYDLSNDDEARRLRGAMGPFGPKWFSAEAAPKRTGKGGEATLPGLEKLADTASLDVHPRLPDLRWAITARKDSANMQPSWYGISGAFGLLLPAASPERRWTAEGYAGLAEQMARENIMPVLAGSKSLHSFGDEIAQDAPQLVDLSGKTDHLQLAALAQEAAFFVSDHADEMQLALSVGCEGVVISPATAPFSAPGRHIVTMTAPAGAGSVDPVFVWRTLANMGLIPDRDGAPVPSPLTAHAR
ncbi:glycosyltransferase family 9 protein [Hyphococcus sp.]|uniref:glycosyltransferase family 9 protein n=1 Tax=Hyphococcus sp. TaxID=2038636 RepID=UPI003CCBECC9